jgi:hypothetical protein
MPLLLAALLLLADAPRTSADMAKVSPAATLKLDAFDAPFAIAIEEAAKASGPRATEPASATAAVVYTCPMHPEVTSPRPGKCPKCGMTLVRK